MRAQCHLKNVRLAQVMPNQEQKSLELGPRVTLLMHVPLLNHPRPLLGAVSLRCVHR